MKRLSLLFLCCGALFAATAIPLFPAQRQFELQLVLAKDHVEGSFLTPETVFADDNYVFLVSFEGQLFVLDKPQPDFPLVVAPHGAQRTYAIEHDFGEAFEADS